MIQKQIYVEIFVYFDFDIIYENYIANLILTQKKLIFKNIS